MEGRGSATLPGAGAGQVREIVADLKRRGYRGWYSIEPHLLSVIHEGKDAAGREEEAWEVFQAYGRAFEALYREASPGDFTKGLGNSPEPSDQ